MTDNSTTDLRLQLDALKAAAQAYFDDQEPDYTEPKFRILEEDGEWVVYEAITKPLASKFAAEHWLNDMRPRCIVCHSYKDSEHDPLEGYQASSRGHVFMHVSCREKFHSWTADQPHGGPIPSLEVLDAAWGKKHPA
jgi:hypothetical protein